MVSFMSVNQTWLPIENHLPVFNNFNIWLGLSLLVLTPLLTIFRYCKK